MAKTVNANIDAVQFVEQASAPTTPASTKWRLYFKSTGLFVVDDLGTELGPLIDASAVPPSTPMSRNNVRHWADDFEMHTSLSGTGITFDVHAATWKMLQSSATAPAFVESAVNHPGIFRFYAPNNGGYTLAGICNDYNAESQAHWNIPSDGTLTIEFLVKPSANPAASQFYWELGLKDENNSNNDVVAVLRHDGTQAVWRLQAKASSTSTTDDTAIAPSAGTWHHIKMVCTASAVTMYLNGTEEATITTNIPTVRMTPYITGIGGVSGSGETLDIDYFSVMIEWPNGR
jgi:hypothetical protein